MLILIDINADEKTVDRIYYLKKGGIKYLDKRLACELKIEELVEKITRPKDKNVLLLDL